MAPGMAGATIYHEKQRERKRESFHGVTVKEKTIKQTNVQRTQNIEGSTTIHDVLEEDGSRTFSKGKYSARLEAGRKTRNRRNAKKRTFRQRSKPEFFVFSRTKIRECTHTRLLLSVFAREIRASMDFSPVSYRVSCASFRPRTRGATPLEQNGKKNEERRTNVSEPERREIGRWWKTIRRCVHVDRLCLLFSLWKGAFSISSRSAENAARLADFRRNWRAFQPPRYFRNARVHQSDRETSVVAI